MAIPNGIKNGMEDNLLNRRSVHEMIKRFQQVPGMHNGWNGNNQVNGHEKNLQNHHSGQSQGATTNGWHKNDGDFFCYVML